LFPKVDTDTVVKVRQHLANTRIELKQQLDDLIE